MVIIINDIIDRFIFGLDDDFSDDQKKVLKNKLIIIMNDYDISRKITDIVVAGKEQENVMMFFVSKKVEGCSDNTIRYYKYVISRFLNTVNRSIYEITANDIRYYIAWRSTKDKLSKTSQDNELRVLKSFFSWLENEDIIAKSPAKSIKSIKKDQRIKKAFTEIEVEKMRNATADLRDKAIFEVLLSTGVRVSELSGMNITDVVGDEVTVFGKGNKERIVYLNAKALVALNAYSKTRDDEEAALFTSAKKPIRRLSKSAIERIVREIGKSAGVKNVHPHRFRRTSATLALNRGMQIDQVALMLGHSNIETTTIYARSENENVKASHKKYVI